MPIADTFLTEWDREAPLTRKTLSRIPAEALDYAPHAKSMTARRLAGHLADIPGWGVVTMEEDVFALDPDRHKPTVPASVAEALSVFDANAARFAESLRGTPDARFQAVWTMKVAGRTVIEAPRAAVLRGFIMNHLVHHRAQLGVYLRMRDVPVPSIYGPSADEGAM